MTPPCIGDPCPSDDAIKADWSCPRCGHGWGPHDVAPVSVTKPMRFVLSGCWACEKKATRTVLEARLDAEDGGAA